MYLDFEVKLPEVLGKIGCVTKDRTTYVRYVAGRTYHRGRKYNIPAHKAIGQQSPKNPSMMIPNENYRQYFGNAEPSERKNDEKCSSCIRIGTFWSTGRSWRIMCFRLF